MPKKSVPKWKAAGFTSKSTYYRNKASGRKKQKTFKGRFGRFVEEETQALKSRVGRIGAGALAQDPNAIPMPGPVRYKHSDSGWAAYAGDVPLFGTEKTDPHFAEVEEAANDDMGLARRIEALISAGAPVGGSDTKDAIDAISVSGLKDVPKTLIAAVAHAIALNRRGTIKTYLDGEQGHIDAAVRKAQAESMIAFGNRLLDRVSDRSDTALIDFTLTRGQVKVLLIGLARVAGNPYI